jgi:hypothetical protein
MTVKVVRLGDAYAVNGIVEFQNASKDFEYKELSVLLDSKGGDVSAAMQIGRLIRKYDGTTLILPLAPWLSSDAKDPRHDR